RVAIDYNCITWEAARKLWRQADPGHSYFHIRVQDKGIGFDTAEAQRIFQLFQRLHGKAEYDGTGIGLAITQKVVDNHHGYIWAEGQPNEGAIFHVLLPAPAHEN